MIRVSLSLMLFFLLISCHQDESGSNLSMGKQAHFDGVAISEEMEQEPPRTKEPISDNDSESRKQNKIIRSGNMGFEVSELNKSKETLDSYLDQLDGYYENENFNSYGHRKQYALSIRVPNERFDSLITFMEQGLGSLKNKSIQARDVSEEYLDLNIRLTNKLAVLEQYRSILKKATTIKDILDVQEKIRRLEEEIESKKGRLKFLDNKVAYSTLQVELYQLIDRPIENKYHFGTRILNAFKSGFSMFLGFVIGLVHFWPFLILLAILIFTRKKIFALIRRRKD